MSAKTTRNEFHLPNSVVEKYLKMPDPFGFNGLGSFVYKRTYSRVKADGTHEAWAETVERVVNGTYSLQKDHVINHSLGWDEEKAKKSAIEMFDLIFHLKFTPPGRGLWAMGTKITEDRGIFAALNNCAYVSTKDVATEKSKPFRFLMDMSMLGVGCGFDVDGRDTCEIKELRGFVPIVSDDPDIEIIYKKNSKKEKTINKYIATIENMIAKSKSRLESMKPDDMVRGSVETDLAMYNRELELVRSYDKRAVVPHVVEDTREGWVVATGAIIDSYFDGGYPVIFDYSKIRKEGIPLKTFGGLSSGPVPLIDLHIMIRNVMGKNAGQPITLRTIVDIMNLIGKCVVAGNVRRSSEIALGPFDNKEFTDLKNYAKNPDRMAYGWCSNNSVYAEVGMDYTEIAKRIVDNGEPGVFWLKNAQAYSRMMDPPDNKDHRSTGTNPCSEQTLESYELCCLCEVYPDKHESKEEFMRTLKFAYLYAKSVTLGDSHWVETNRVMKRNRRIGCSVTGLVQFIASKGLHTLKTWLTEGYDTIQHWDQVYSEYLTIPRSVKTTSVKPSGCVTLDTKVIVAKKDESEQSITMQGLFDHCGVDLPAGEQQSTWSGEQWHDVSSYGLTTTTHTGEVQPINKLFINGLSDCYEIPLDNGTSIKCTAEHKFMVRRNGVDEWVRCDQLREGDEFTSV